MEEKEEKEGKGVEKYLPNSDFSLSYRELPPLSSQIAVTHCVIGSYCGFWKMFIYPLFASV